MKYRFIRFASLIFTLTVNYVYCQNELKARSYNSLSFFYVDNSQNFELNSLNSDVKDMLINKLKEQANVQQNCFYFIGCSGNKPKTSGETSNFITNDFINKYLERASRSPDYTVEKAEVRDYFATYPVKIKQSVEVDYFLSSNAVNKIITDVELLPTPLLLPQELLIYLNSSSEIKYHVNFYLNKEITEKFSEEKIKNSFFFCNSFLNENKIQAEFHFL